MKHLKSLALPLCAAAFLLSACHTSIDQETVGGTLVGLSTTGSPSVVLQNNGTDNLTLTKNGTFTFAKALNTGSTYSITVLTQPAGELCSVQNSSGYVSANIGNVSSAVVNCVTSVSSSDAVYGTVTGLTTKTLELTNNGVDTVSLNGTSAGSLQSFAFSQALPIGSSYQVAISQQPTGQNCTITAGATGTISATVALTPVAVSCI
jgi:hypothetical protein